MKGWYWTPAQRQALERALAHTHDAALFRRLTALLQLDQGESVEDIARFLGVDRSSVYRWAQRFAAGHNPKALEHQPGQGRPVLWSQELERLLESALARTPLQLGYPANSWTVPLLQALFAVSFPEQEVSADTVRRRLRDLGYVWKRFRYVLAPDPEQEKKTPAAAPDPLLAPANGPAGRGRN